MRTDFKINRFIYGISANGICSSTKFFAVDCGLRLVRPPKKYPPALSRRNPLSIFAKKFLIVFEQMPLGALSFIKASRWKKGITVLEYALLITIFFAAIMSMQVLLRRALSSKWRETADSFGFGRQYVADGAARTTIVDR